MTLSPEDRTRIVETMARADAAFDGRPWLSMPAFDRARYAERSAAALDAALSAGLADALQPQLGPELAAAIDNPPPPSDGLRELMRREPAWKKAIRGKALEDAANIATLYAEHWNKNAKKEKIDTVGQSVCESAGAAGHEIALAILALRNKETNG
jgi:hypothetical protein